MGLHEATAERWQKSVGFMQETYAEAYRAAIGVHPSRRSVLRTALEILRDGKTEGDVTVESIVFNVNSLG
jgi:hypothetical protein